MTSLTPNCQLSLGKGRRQAKKDLLVFPYQECYPSNDIDHSYPLVWCLCGKLILFFYKIKGQKQVSQDQLRSSMPKISFRDLNLLKWIYYLFIRPVVSILALTLFIRYICHWNLQFLNNIIMIKTKVLIPRAYVTFVGFGYMFRLFVFIAPRTHIIQMSLVSYYLSFLIALRKLCKHFNETDF
jgi:hypothetical protein